MLLTYFIFIIIAICIYFTSVLTGILFIKLTKISTSKNIYENYFLESFWGISIIIFLYSIFSTKGLTIFSLSVIPIVGLLIYKKTNQVINFEIKDIALKSFRFGSIFFIIFLLSFFWNYHHNFNNDIIFYSNIGHHLSNGNENTYHFFKPLIRANTEGVFPYHYFEMWFQSLIEIFVKGIPSSILLKYLVYNYLKTSIIIGIESIISHFKKTSITTFILVILISLIPFDIYLNLFNIGHKYQLNMWQRQNFLTYLFVLIPFSIYTLKQKYFLSIYTIMLLPLISIVATPSILCFVVTYTILLKLIKYIKTKEMLYLLITEFSLAFSIIIFYNKFGLKLEGLNYTIEDLINTYSNNWKTMILYIIALPLGTLTLMIPLYYYTRKLIQDRKQIILIILSSFLITSYGVIIFQLGFFIGDFYQFPFVGYSFVYLISIILLFLSFLSEKRFFKFFSYIILIIGLSFSTINITLPKSVNLIKNNMLLSKNSHTKARLDKKSVDLIYKNKEKIKNRGFFILNEEAIERLTFSERTFSYNQYANFLYYLNPSIELIPLLYSKELYSSKHESKQFAKALQFNSLLPKELFENSLTNLKTKVIKYNVKFLFIEGDNKLKTCSKIFPNAEILKLNNARYILILNKR
ncbi:MAG: hypothetical protein N4A35_07365 [Flavobacteriales bacterium]|jgi:hypothetical protein|nr:hypothetical protein [Flavobacteriales bacterium]